MKKAYISFHLDILLQGEGTYLKKIDVKKCPCSNRTASDSHLSYVDNEVGGHQQYDFKPLWYKTQRFSPVIDS